MNKGVLKALGYYVAGLVLACTSYLIVGYEYAHAPGLHHILVFLTFVGGLVWMIAAIARYASGYRSKSLKGMILTTTFMSVGFALLMLYLIDGSKHDGLIDVDRLTIDESGDTTTLRYNGSPVYIKVKDSVLINFIDSARMDWNKVERIKK